MKAMTIMKRCREADSEIRRIEMRVRQRREAMDAMGGMRLDPVGGGKGSADRDKMGRMMGEVDEIERKLQERREEKMAEIASAVMLLEMVPDLESDILHRYYIMKKSTGEIAREIRRESSYVRKKKKDGEIALGYLGWETVNGTLPAWYLRRLDWDD